MYDEEFELWWKVFVSDMAMSQKVNTHKHLYKMGWDAAMEVRDEQDKQREYELEQTPSNGPGGGYTHRELRGCFFIPYRLVKLSILGHSEYVFCETVPNTYFQKPPL